MATVSSVAPGPIRFSRRVLEWGLLATVVIGLVLLFVRQQREVQGQAELAAITSTLGALRTSLVLREIQNQVEGRHDVAVAQQNPFVFLQRLPANYAGMVRPGEAMQVRAGSWVYDANCRCIGYTPMNAQWLSSPGGEATIRFRVDGSGKVLQLVAMDAYTWRGQPLR